MQAALDGLIASGTVDLAAGTPVKTRRPITTQQVLTSVYLSGRLNIDSHLCLGVITG
jgi:hypothetical protein